MLDRLPAECVALIVRHVPLRTLLDCTSTCHTCLAVAALDDVWWDLFRRVAPDRMPSAVGDGGYRAAFRAYVLSDSPIIVQLEPTRTLVGFATEGAQRVRVLPSGARCKGRLQPDGFEACGQALLLALGLTSLLSMSVVVLISPLDNAPDLRALMYPDDASRAPEQQRSAESAAHMAGDRVGTGRTSSRWARRACGCSTARSRSSPPPVPPTARQPAGRAGRPA